MNQDLVSFIYEISKYLDVCIIVYNGTEITRRFKEPVILQDSAVGNSQKWRIQFTCIF